MQKLFNVAISWGEHFLLEYLLRQKCLKMHTIKCVYTNEIHLNILLCVPPSDSLLRRQALSLCSRRTRISFAYGKCFAVHTLSAVLLRLLPYFLTLLLISLLLLKKILCVCLCECCSVHFVLSNNLASFIWLHWIEASSCCYMVILKVAQNPWKMSKIATKWKWQATIKRVPLCTMLRCCNDLVPFLPILCSRLLCCICLCHRLYTRLVRVRKQEHFYQIGLNSMHIHSVHVHKCARWSQSKCSQIYKWKCGKKAEGNRSATPPWMCKLRELQTMQL